MAEHVNARLRGVATQFLHFREEVCAVRVFRPRAVVDDQIVILRVEHEAVVVPNNAKGALMYGDINLCAFMRA